MIGDQSLEPREPARQLTGRLSSPVRSRDRLKGGLEHCLANHAQGHTRPIERLLRTSKIRLWRVDAPRSLTRWANWNYAVCFTALAPLLKRAPRGSRTHQSAEKAQVYA